MKKIVAITLLAAVLTGGFIWRNQLKIGALRSENRMLYAEAAAQGIRVDADGRTARLRSRPRVDAADEALRITREMIDAASNADSEIDQDALVDRVLALSARQLRSIIDDFRHRPDIDESLRTVFFNYLISRLSDDFPEDALEILADIEATQPELLNSTRIESIKLKAVNTWGAADPDKAWAWFQEHKDSMAERQVTPVLWSLLNGVAKTHPADAIDLALEAGLEPKNLPRILAWPDQSVDEKVAAYIATRDWCRRSENESHDILQQTVRELALNKSHDREIRFDTVTGWIRQAGVTPDEVGFLADPSRTDLSFYIDPLETGLWMNWLRETFPEDQVKRRFQRLLEDHRTQVAAKKWLSDQPDEVADRLLDRAR